MNFKITDQSVYEKLVGKNVLLMMKGKLNLTEVKVIETTQYRIRVKIIGKPNAIMMGVKKTDCVIFPIRVPRNRLRNIIKTVTEINNSLEKYIKQFAYQVSK